MSSSQAKLMLQIPGPHQYALRFIDLRREWNGLLSYQFKSTLSTQYSRNPTFWDNWELICLLINLFFDLYLDCFCVYLALPLSLMSYFSPLSALIILLEPSPNRISSLFPPLILISPTVTENHTHFIFWSSFSHPFPWPVFPRKELGIHCHAVIAL